MMFGFPRCRNPPQALQRQRKIGAALYAESRAAPRQEGEGVTTCAAERRAARRLRAASVNNNQSSSAGGVSKKRWWHARAFE